MIFVTVGTHEQQFNRLICCIDDMKKNKEITEEVVIQTGFSTYEPQYCEWKKLFTYQEMLEYVKNARIVITHGGPSSFIMPLQMGKIPVVVPRSKEFGEHVNNHQVDFCKYVAERQGNIIVAEEAEELCSIIKNYSETVGKMSQKMTSNNEEFTQGFNGIVEELFR